MKYGEEAFEFRVLIICFDEDRFEFEKEYIQRYNTMVPNGYNILEGGVGGAGFRGKTHSAEVRERMTRKLRETMSKTEYKKVASERGKKQMEKIKEAGIDWGKKVKESEKFQKAKAEGRMGGKGRVQTDEEKKKISESVKKWFHDDPTNIENHRKAMAAASGKKVSKLDSEGNVLESYDSIAEAARANGIIKSGIRAVLDLPHRKAG